MLVGPFRSSATQRIDQVCEQKARRRQYQVEDARLQAVRFMHRGKLTTRSPDRPALRLFRLTFGMSITFLLPKPPKQVFGNIRDI
jgi:hypothetical protein